MVPRSVAAIVILLCSGVVYAEEPPRRTTLSDPSIPYTVPELPYVVLRRGAVEAVVVDNRAVNDGVLPGHQVGFNGVASLRHETQPQNIFVPRYGGLNFEFIHDGTSQDYAVLFEPRNAPMELRVIDDHTAELYQAPTPHWSLESATRYELLPDGTIEMTLECIPRVASYANGYIGLFWASYIDQPESLDIHFVGPQGWVRGVTPQHGVNAVHRAVGDERTFTHDSALAERVPLLFGFSPHRYSEAWYFGICRGMALALVFREPDMIRLTQSPSGGGQGNPAWDFQWYIEHPEVGRRYQMVMRAVYVPYESYDQVRALVEPHRQAVNGLPLEPVASPFALHGLRPNPTAGACKVAFSLPDASPTRLEVMDISGRRIWVRDVGVLDHGAHVIDLAPDQALPAGIYFVRLTRREGAIRAKLAIVK